MSYASFGALHQQFRRLYDAGEHAQALEMFEQEQATFPQHAHEIAYWRMCLYTLVGKQAEALHIFRETLARGDWFAPTLLEEDRDLASLRPLPEFQEMAEVCRKRLAEIKGNARAELLVAAPKEQAAALPLLIALHGNEENARVTIGEWDGVVAQGWLVGVPTSSQIVGPDEFVWDEREPGISEVRGHFAALSSAYRIDPELVALGGYSMGGGLAVWMALHQSIQTCGFVVLAPYLTPGELEALPAALESQKLTHFRGSILVGEEDIECLEASRKVAEIMQAYHLPCELQLRPGTDHTYPPNFGEYVREGLAFIEQR